MLNLVLNLFGIISASHKIIKQFMIPLYILIFILGTVIGSFLNVVILRTYRKESFVSGRSYCPKCFHQINWYDNIPLLSFLILKGRCRYCHKKISWQYFLIEFLTGLLFLLIAYDLFHNSMVFSLNLKTYLLLLRNIFVVSVLIIVFFFFLYWYVILDRIILPASIIVLVLNLFLDIDFLNLLLGAFLGGGFFLAQFLISKGRWIGGGDIRLGFFMGLSLGFPLIFLALFFAYMSGSIISIFLILFKKRKINSKIPFGVFLAPATFVTLVYGERILDWYLRYTGVY